MSPLVLWVGPNGYSSSTSISSHFISMRSSRPASSYCSTDSRRCFTCFWLHLLLNDGTLLLRAQRGVRPLFPLCDFLGGKGSTEGSEGPSTHVVLGFHGFREVVLNALGDGVAHRVLLVNGRGR